MIGVADEPAARDFKDVSPFAWSAATGEHPPGGIQAQAFPITLVRIRQRAQFLTRLRIDHLQYMVLEVCPGLRSAHRQNLTVAGEAGVEGPSLKEPKAMKRFEVVGAGKIAHDTFTGLPRQGPVPLEKEQAASG